MLKHGLWEPRRGNFAWNIARKIWPKHESLEQALKLDPDYAFLWTAMGHTHFVDARFGWTKSRAKSYKQAFDFAKKALTINDSNPKANAEILGVPSSL